MLRKLKEKMSVVSAKLMQVATMLLLLGSNNASATDDPCYSGSELKELMETTDVVEDPIAVMKGKWMVLGLQQIDFADNGTTYHRDFVALDDKDKRWRGKYTLEKKYGHTLLCLRTNLVEKTENECGMLLRFKEQLIKLEIIRFAIPGCRGKPDGMTVVSGSLMHAGQSNEIRRGKFVFDPEFAETSSLDNNGNQKISVTEIKNIAQSMQGKKISIEGILVNYQAVGIAITDAYDGYFLEASPFYVDLSHLDDFKQRYAETCTGGCPVTIKGIVGDIEGMPGLIAGYLEPRSAN